MLGSRNSLTSSHNENKVLAPIHAGANSWSLTQMRNCLLPRELTLQSPLPVFGG